VRSSFVFLPWPWCRLFPQVQTVRDSERRRWARVPLPGSPRGCSAMKKAKFIQDAKLSPARYYRNPSDVVRDRRLTNADRLEILAAWERDAREQQDLEEVSEGDPLEELRRVREEVERSEKAAHGRSAAEANAEEP